MRPALSLSLRERQRLRDSSRCWSSSSLVRKSFGAARIPGHYEHRAEAGRSASAQGQLGRARFHDHYEGGPRYLLSR